MTKQQKKKLKKKIKKNLMQNYQHSDDEEDQEDEYERRAAHAAAVKHWQGLELEKPKSFSLPKMGFSEEAETY
jgi:hypothetical protein